jgi:transcription elongation factor GreA
MDGKIFYITKAKLQELKKEYDELVLFERNKEGADAPKIFESESVNPEFIIFQENLEFLKSRILELKNILEHHELIKVPPKDKRNFVAVGAKVRIEIDGQKDDFTIVGTLEANPALGKISNESPVGKALMGHRAGEEVIVSSPIKTIYKIKSIKYEVG